MQIEVREDSVVVSGYVNAVERWSKPIRANLRGKMQRFVEKIKAGAFTTALKRNDNVKVLLNHNSERELANTLNGTAKLEEDNIGLRAEVTITDAEVVEKAKNHKLVGWSFGFYSNADDIGDDGTMATRTVNDMDLVEVSILDDTKSPAYYGTSIETRSDDGRMMEIREQTLADIEKEAKEKHKQVSSAEEAKFDQQMELHEKIDVEANEKKMDLFATLVATKVAEMLKTDKRAEETTEKVEEEQAEAENPEAEEKRAVDYSAFEERLAKLN